jgi:hypothetical protein
MSFIEPKNSLFNEIEKNKVVKDIFDRLVSIENFKSYKDDLEFLLFACMMVEHLVDNANNKNKIDKKEIIFSVYDKIFGQVDRKLIEKNIEFLINNKRIKKVGCLNALYGSLKVWLKKKLNG